MSMLARLSRPQRNRRLHLPIIVLCALLAAACATRPQPAQTDPECHPGVDAAVRSGDWEAARQAHERLLAQMPANCLAIYHLGYIWGQLGDRGQEIHFYEAAVACGYTDDDRLYFNLGMAYADLGEYQPASNALAQAVRLRPEQADNHFGLGLMNQLAGRPDEAEAALLHALQLDRGHEDARLALIRLYLDQSRWDEARRQLRMIKTEDPGFEAAKELWEILESREAAEYQHRAR